jgi:phage-related protein
MALVDQAAMLAPGGRVRLVEVDASEFSGGIHRFTTHLSPIHRKRSMLRMVMKKSSDQSQSYSVAIPTIFGRFR